ncbi:hypothetical protein FRC01_000322 [Tulasnella sp. 417]|nr:hypothetical protein FRC01_000322 [Tulasnella sp. 417]
MQNTKSNRDDDPLGAVNLLSYSAMTRVVFQEQSEAYDQFLEIMNDFTSQRIDVSGTIERLSTLFQGHPTSIQEFNNIPHPVSPQPTRPSYPITPRSQTVLGEHQPLNERPNGSPAAGPPIVFTQPEQHAQATVQENKRATELNQEIRATNGRKNEFVAGTNPPGRFLETQRTLQDRGPTQDAYNQVPVLLECPTKVLDGFNGLEHGDTVVALKEGMRTGGSLFSMIGPLVTSHHEQGYPNLPLRRAATKSSALWPNSLDQTFDPSSNRVDVTRHKIRRNQTLDETRSPQPPSPSHATSWISGTYPFSGTHGQSGAGNPKPPRGGTAAESSSDHPSDLDLPRSISQSTWQSEAYTPPTATILLSDDIRNSITWISPYPVKINGRFCDVFEGNHTKAGRVALKRPRIGATGYDDVILRRFEREAAAWRMLRHPHVLRFLGTLKYGGHIYFVSPFIKNGTLVEYIGDYPDVNRIQLLCETADAVHYLHKEGIVHGDLKANNILIDDNGSSLLCDFGLSRTTDSRTSTSMKGAGTFRWQSPELWENRPKSFESDVYAFGMTIAEVLTGKVPFADLQNNMAVMFAVMTRDERPSRVPIKSSSGVCYESIWHIAAACWPRDPTERISMLDALGRIQKDPSLKENRRT